jgi:hypothetical protein
MNTELLESRIIQHSTKAIELLLPMDCCWRLATDRPSLVEAVDSMGRRNTQLEPRLVKKLEWIEMAQLATILFSVGKERARKKKGVGDLPKYYQRDAA